MVRMPIIAEGWLEGGSASKGGPNNLADARVREGASKIDLSGLSSLPTPPATGLQPQSNDPMRRLLDAISNSEGTGADAVRNSNGKFSSSYDVTYKNNAYAVPEKPVSQMNLDELDRYQTRMLENPANKAISSPVGRYQIVQKTLRGLRHTMSLDGSEIFSPELQDRLAQRLIHENGLRAYSAGRISSDRFQDGLAKQWDSIADPITGKTKHGGRLGMTTEQVQAIISGFPKAR